MPRTGYAESQYRVSSVLEGLASIGVPPGELPALITMTCINCGLKQPSADHCRSCLWSLHLPPVPGPINTVSPFPLNTLGRDRRGVQTGAISSWTDCLGPMRPVDVTKDEVTHRCDKCGQVTSASLSNPTAATLTSTSADDGAADTRQRPLGRARRWITRH